jgi:hypothetical protein
MKYIASMTTYPARFSSALLAIESINNQTIKPESLVIHISEEDWRQAQKDFIRPVKFRFKGKVIIEPCENLKPANKIIHTAKKFPEKNIITFDDDVLYPRNRAENLIEKHKLYPNNPICFRTRRVSFNKEQANPYSKWNLIHDRGGANYLNFPTSVSGSFYPAGIFPESFFDTQTYSQICQNNDDIWTYFHMLMSDLPFVSGGSEIVPTGVSGAQDSALWKRNVRLNGNDKIISDMEKRYGSIYSLIGDKSEGS